MKKVLFISVLIAFAALSCAEKNKNWSVEIENPTNTTRTDEAIVLTRSQLQPVDSRLMPAVMDRDSNYVSSQLDDINMDGKWDELAFVVNLAPAEKARFRIVWLKPEDYPMFKARTNIRYGVMVSDAVIVEKKTDTHYKESQFFINTAGYPYQMDGVAWENDKVGFRHYFDGRNSRDFFGKRVADMVLDTVGIKPNGTPGDTYHVWADWGRDIMAVGTTFGIGGIGAWVDGERFVRLGRLATETTDNIDSTRYTQIIEGPVRSMFAFDFYGWQVEDNKVDSIRQEVTIWAGKNNYENKVIAKKLPSNIKLITGMARIFNDKPLEEMLLFNHTAMITHDYQSYNKEFVMGNALIIPNKNLERIFDTPDEGPGLIKTWCAELKLDDNGEAGYNAYAAWEHQDTLFRSRDYFINFIKTEGEKLDYPVKVTLVNEVK